MTPPGGWRGRARSRRTLLLALGLGLAAGCAALPPAAPEAWMRSELYFGRARPDGTAVSEAEWRAFLVEEVTPRFPAGLTVIDGAGQYRARSGEIVHEQMKVLVVYHPSSPKARAALDAVRAAYKARFAQESVLLVTSPARVDF